MQSDIKKTGSKQANEIIDAVSLVLGLGLGTAFGLLILKLMGVM